MRYFYQIIYSLMFFFNISFCDKIKFNIETGDETSNPKSDIYLDSLQLIKKYNYPAERHVVVTEDGYLLKTFRIPRRGPPVLLVHGIGDSSDSWIVLGPGKSLAFLLADAGFDVWLYNARGNRYCKKNVKSLSGKQFWNFSFEEMGTEDLPATIDYILRKTLTRKLTYVGFSQGTTAFLIMCSTKPEYNEKINYSILLAPVAWLTYTKYPFIKIFNHLLSDLMEFSEKSRIFEAFPFNKRLNFYHAKVCNTTASYSFLCHLELYLNFGLGNLSDLTPERLPVISSHIPSGTSVKTFFHFLQLYSSKRFQRYDYGLDMNMKMYSTPHPPEYNVSLVSVPSSLIVSEVDWFSDTSDTNLLKNKLRNIQQFIVINKSLEFTHLEFAYGSRVNEYINKPVITTLNNLRNSDLIDIR